MSIHCADLDHRTYVVFAVLTHAAVGYVIVSASTGRSPLTGAGAAVLPDMDLLFAPDWAFPFVHRGLTHSPLFGVGVVVAVGLWERRRASSYRGGRTVAATLGFGSHLALDSLTASGVPWLYPLSTTGYGVELAIHAPAHAAVVWACLGAIWLRWRRPTDDPS